MKKIILINKIVFFLIFKYCLYFNLESKSTLKGLGGFQNFKKSTFFCLFNSTIWLEYSLLYGAGIDDAM